MRFVVTSRGQWQSSDLRAVAVLEIDRWDDFGFQTMFHLTVVDENGGRHGIGTVKIGRYGMTDRDDLGLPGAFESLSEEYFSVGQEDTYYEQLARLGAAIRTEVLSGLRDMAFDSDILESARDEGVTRTSLWRFVNPGTIEEQFSRIAKGGKRVMDFLVTYRLPDPGGDEDDGLRLTFHARPGSHPPSNIHVLTGRNGAGKSVLLNRLARAAADPHADRREVGEITELGRAVNRSFTNLVYVSFSAFDDLPHIPDGEQFPTDHVGLRALSPAAAPRRGSPERMSTDVADSASARAIDDVPYLTDGEQLRTDHVAMEVCVREAAPKLKSPERLRKDFADSVEACLTGGHSERWTKALETLTYAGSGLLEDGWLEEFRATSDTGKRRTKARALFRQLSSGHKVVLLTITRLVELVGERTLVIIDEPETHLHPPLLSALVRAVSDLLTDRNALAIVATHSPVVLQEVPADCVYKLRRYGDRMVADRPTLETFGENVGILTHEVFGLEVTHTGFHQALSRLVSAGLSYDEILHAFEEKIGGEAQILTRSLVATREVGEGQGGELF